MWSDPIADMLTRVRNAAAVHRKSVNIPSSKMKVGIAEVLKKEGYINGYDVVDDAKQGILRIDLKYGPRGEDVIHQLKRWSRPGRREFRKADDLPRVLDGLGIAVVSTSRGLLSDRDCREQNVGGELVCTVY